jgi:hypothetical protein
MASPVVSLTSTFRFLINKIYHRRKIIYYKNASNTCYDRSHNLEHYWVIALQNIFYKMNSIKIYNWQKISLFNLLLVSLLGVILRYKIAFSLPFIDQKFLLHAHSHFAFAGWISQVLMAFIIKYLYDKDVNIQMQKYQWMLWANIVSAYGMLFSFPLEGYGTVSIIFSTLSIFVSYAFAFFIWKDLNKLKTKCVSHYWFKAALAFNAISSLGAFSLAFMMATKTVQTNFYLAAIYFFLHFQYNGWFFFACMGLALAYMTSKNIAPSIKTSKTIFWLFFIAAIPAYFLSALWLPIPQWIYVMVVFAAAIQCVGFILLIKYFLNHKNILNVLSKQTKVLWVLTLLALGIKLTLQMISVVPSLSILTVGFRPIVIAYLHLVLLGVITIFLIGYFTAINPVHNKRFFKGVTVFVTGIIVNEILLMIQGITGLTYTNVPYINEMLFVAALIMFSGLFILNASLLTASKEQRPYALLAS